MMTRTTKISCPACANKSLDAAIDQYPASAAASGAAGSAGGVAGVARRDGDGLIRDLLLAAAIVAAMYALMALAQGCVDVVLRRG